MKITITNSKGSFDATELVTAVRWSGDYRQCARTLSLGLLSSELFDVVDCAPGAGVAMQEGGRTIFTGFVFDRTKSTASQVIDLTCFDHGFYLNRNQTAKKYVGMTPEAAAAALASEFGLAVGTLATTGVPVSRNFPASARGAPTLYEIIMTLYTEAAKTTGKAYFASFSGGVLSVLEKGSAGKILVIEGGSNLIDATVTESAQGVVNRVAVYDKNDNPLYTKSDDASAALYGVLQTAIKQADGKDAAATVTELLKKAAPEQKITVNNLGDISCVTGGAVMLHEPYTNLYGKFYIDSDLHQWKYGVYTNKLTLNLVAVMDEKSAGQEIEASGSLGAGGASSKEQQYIKNLEENTKYPPTGGGEE